MLAWCKQTHLWLIKDEGSCEGSSGDEIWCEPEASDSDEKPRSTSDAGAAAAHGMPEAGPRGDFVLAIPMDMRRLQNTEWWDLILTQD